MEKNKEYFEKQIKGLIMILESNQGMVMVARNYVIEKLNMILGYGINFHPTIHPESINKITEGDF